jgi:hypothetical protein
MSDVAISAALDAGMAGSCNAISQAAMTITLLARNCSALRSRKRGSRASTANTAGSTAAATSDVTTAGPAVKSR